MSEQNLRLLLVEDNEDHAALVFSYLEDSGVPVGALDQSECLQDALQRLGAARYDVVLLDLGLPDSRGLHSLPKVSRAAGQAAMIVLTALDDRKLGVNAVQQGAQDYLVKGRLDAELLRRSIHYAVERKRVLSELQQSNEDLSRFAYRVAHDLKNPLRTIVQFCQRIHARQGNPLDETSAESLDFVVTAGKRLSTLVDDLLHFASVSHEKRQFQSVDCGQILGQVLEHLGEAISESGATVTQDPLPRINGNSSLLASLFQNLLENALKHGGVEDLKIHISAEQRGADWVFSVQDNGQGIPLDKLKEIFLPFERLQTRTGAPGSGIGLATCKRIVELHGGRIWVESEPGQGAAFRFTRPQAPGCAGRPEPICRIPP